MILQDTNQWIGCEQDEQEVLSQSDSEESPPNSPCELSMETSYQDSPPPLVADFTIESMDETGETHLFQDKLMTVH